MRALLQATQRSATADNEEGRHSDEEAKAKSTNANQADGWVSVDSKIYFPFSLSLIEIP